MTACGNKAVSSAPPAVESLVFPDVPNYSCETQTSARNELKAMGCLPVEGKPIDCKIPTIYRLNVDHYKMRQQTRIALGLPEPKACMNK